MEPEGDAALGDSDPSMATPNIEASDSLARDMIDVHGAEAATIARNNARAAAVAAQIPAAKAWIRVLEIIQRIRAAKG